MVSCSARYVAAAFAVIFVGALLAHHRRGGGFGDLDGADLAADHAAPWLRPAPGEWCDRSVRHAGADHPAVVGADHLADQLGRSVGDMYKGAFIPGFILTGLYPLRDRRCLAIVKPAWVPALPPEARTIREDDGKSGLPSLVLR